MTLSGGGGGGDGGVDSRGLLEGNERSVTVSWHRFEVTAVYGANTHFFVDLEGVVWSGV